MGIESLLQQNMQSAGLAGIDRLAGNAMYPQSYMDKTQYAVPSQMPTSAEVMRSDYDSPTQPYTGMQPQMMAKGGIATLRYDEGGETTAPEEQKPLTMSELAAQLNEAYRSNVNYDDIWKQFEATREQDPQEWYKKQLGFLGGQQGWQIGQNTGERAEALQPQIQDTINQAKLAGLKEEEINAILGGSSQEANAANQRRIAEEAAQGKGWVNQTIPGGWTTVGAAAALAAAPYLAPELFASMGAAEGAGALTTTELLGGAGGAFVPTAGSGASFILPAAAELAGGAGALTTAELMGGAGGAFVPAEGASFVLPEGLSAINPATGLSWEATGSGYAAGAGAPVAEGGMSAKQAMNLYRGANMLNSAFGGGETQAGYGAAPIASAPATIPNITRSGVTGYYGAAEAPDYRTAMALQRTPYLSRLRGGYGETAFAAGGIADLGSYSDGGRLLKGPGDGMSDHIPAKIGDAQPARLADGEFVVPADVVSHLGNGSTDAGAKQLYAMMDKVRKARTGNKKQGKQINPSKFLP